MLAPPKPVRVLFDESHSEAWTIRPDVAEAMQPSHPADSSLANAANALAEREFEVAVHTEGALDADALAAAQVLVIAHPSDSKWEATVAGGSPLLSAEEIDAIEAFVAARRRTRRTRRDRAGQVRQQRERAARRGSA